MRSLILCIILYIAAEALHNEVIGFFSVLVMTFCALQLVVFMFSNMDKWIVHLMHFTIYDMEYDHAKERPDEVVERAKEILMDPELSEESALLIAQVETRMDRHDIHEAFHAVDKEALFDAVRPRKGVWAWVNRAWRRMHRSSRMR